MGISRTPFREALRELAAEGFVMLSPNQGVVVRSVSAENIKEVLQIRSVLDGLAARLATYVITEEEIKELESYNKKMEKLASKKDVFAYSEVDIKFHKFIANICQNKRLIKIRKNISSQALRYRVSSLRIPGRLQKTIKKHLNIVEAIKAKDPKRADRMGREHSENALKNIINHIKIKVKDNT